MSEKRVATEVSIAIADAIQRCDVDVIAAYPITPQTHVVEHLSEIVASGELDAEYIPVESEQSAMAACCGSSAMGARTFTSTASQGLALMSEIVYIARSLRLPIVMAVANRALSGPISIWNDHSDVMSVRDCGWVSLFVENGQEAFDLMIMAFKIAEDHRVLLPTMVNFDGFMLSHIIEPIMELSEEDVRSFLPPFVPKYRLDPSKPMMFGAVGMPEIYTEAKKQEHEALNAAMPVIKECFADFAKRFNREYKVVESYRMEDAETALITMGGISETASVAIDEMRAEGRKIGQVRLRVWRPFPHEELAEALAGVKNIAVFDRCLSPAGPGGPVFSEIRSSFYDQEDKPNIYGFIGGLGGRDVPRKEFTKIIDMTEEAVSKGELIVGKMIGLRE
jgi:pyruvate ferredoxin oxidoreductase alpha subunit